VRKFPLYALPVVLAGFPGAAPTQFAEIVDNLANTPTQFTLSLVNPGITPPTVSLVSLNNILENRVTGNTTTVSDKKGSYSELPIGKKQSVLVLNAVSPAEICVCDLEKVNEV